VIVDDRGQLSSFGLDDLFDALGGNGDVDGMMADLDVMLDALGGDAGFEIGADAPAMPDLAALGSDLVDDDLPLG
jgi:hypothetical protein